MHSYGAPPSVLLSLPLTSRKEQPPGRRKAPPSSWTGSAVQIWAPDGRIRQRWDERVAVDHHRHRGEWTRVAAARVSEMPEPPHLVQWRRRPRCMKNRATGRRSGVGAEPKFSVAATAGSHGRSSSVDMEEPRASGRGSRAARTTGLHGRRLHGSRRVQIAIWGKEQGRGGEVREKEAVDGCERAPVVRIRRRPAAATMAASPG